MSSKLPNRSSSSQNKIVSTKNTPFTNSDGTEVSTCPRELSPPITNNHTYLDPKDESSNQDEIAGWPPKWKRLELINRGILNGKWSNQTMKRSQDDWYFCRNVACQVGLSKSAKETVWQIFSRLDMRSFKKYESHPECNYTIQPSRSDEHLSSITPIQTAYHKHYLVIFAICALLYNRNRSDHQQKYYPGKGCESRDRYGVNRRFVRNLVDEDLKDCNRLLQQFAEQLGFSEEHIRSCMEKLRQDCL